MKTALLSLLLGSAALAQVPTTGGGGVNLSAVGVSIKPASNGSLSLGSSSKRWSAGFMLSINSGASALTLTSGIANEGGPAFVANTSNTLTSGSVFCFKNNGVELLCVDYTGALVPGAHAQMDLGGGARAFALIRGTRALIAQGMSDDSGSRRIDYTYNTDMTYRANGPDGAATIAHTFLSTVARTTDGAKVARFYSDDAVTPAVDLSAEGGIRANAGNIAKPTCGTAFRGQLWFTEGGAGVADTWEICRKDSSDVYAWTAH